MQVKSIPDAPLKLMQVKRIAECSHLQSAITLTCIKLPHGFKTFVYFWVAPKDLFHCTTKNDKKMEN